MFNNIYSKYFLFTISVVILLLGLSQSALALEINYPSTTYGGGSGFNPNLNQYIVYVFWMIIISSGTIGIISIVISGFKILVSFGNPEKVGEAKKNIFSIVIGILLLMTSVIIFATINSELVTPVITKLPLENGVYLRHSDPGSPYAQDDGYIYIQAPESSSYTDNINLPAPVELYYHCSIGGGTGANLLVWEYSLPNLTVDSSSTETTLSVPCNSSIPLSGVISFSRSYEEPGVYFYKDPNCTGYSSGVHKVTNKISGITFDYREIKSMRIVSGYKKDERYGVILNRQSDWSGECSGLKWNPDPGNVCIDSTNFPTPLGASSIAEPFNPSAMYIVQYDYDTANGLSYGGNEGNVKLLSDNYIAILQQTGSSSTYTGTLPSATPPFPTNYDIGEKYVFEGNPNDLIKNMVLYEVNGSGIYTDGPGYEECCTEYTDITAHPECAEVDPNNYEKNCLRSVIVNGSYYVVLYSRNAQTGELTCEIFTNSVKYSGFSDDLLGDEKELYKLTVFPKY